MFLLDFKEPVLNIKAKRYSDTLKRLSVGIMNKCPGKPTNGVNLLHDDAQSHVAHKVQTLKL